MRTITQHAALAIPGILAGAVLAALLIPHRAHHDPPAGPGTPEVAPRGSTVVCGPTAIWIACHTYPPGDDGWMRGSPVPPQRPLPTPWPGGEDAR